LHCRLAWQTWRSKFSNTPLFTATSVFWQCYTFRSVSLYSLCACVLLSECHDWSAAPISAYLRLGQRGYFRSECCIGGESIAAPRVNRFLQPSIKVEHEAGHVASTFCQVFGVTRPGIEPRLPALVARAQPTLSLYYCTFSCMIFCTVMYLHFSILIKLCPSKSNF